jgi:ligand-binding sensor domain-containing protein
MPMLAGAGEVPRVINFPPPAYQAQHQNWMVAQAPNGFMYFANSAGLLEYDGQRWTLYPLPEGQIVRALACSADGRIFTGGFAEFGYWQRRGDGQLQYHSLSASLVDAKISQEEIWHILLVGDKVFFQSFSALYQYRNGVVTALSTPGNIMYLREVAGRVLLPVIGQGLYEMDAQGRFVFLPGSGFLRDMTVMDILPYREGLLICTNRDGLFTYHQGGQFMPWSNPLNESLKTLQLNKALWLPDGSLALGTIIDGLYCLDQNGRQAFHLNRANGLQDNTILALCASQDGNLWLGLDQGISLLTLSDALSYFNDQSGRIGAVYTAAIHEGLLYIGTNHGLFAKPWPLQPGRAFRLVEGTPGQAWEVRAFGGQLLCGHNDGTFLIQGQRATKISDVTGGWVTIPVPGQPDWLLQGAYTGIIALRKDRQGGWRFSHRLDGFQLPAKSLAWDGQGHLWVSNPYRGLYRLQLDEELRTVIELQSFTKADGLPSELRISIQMLNGQLLVRAGNDYWRWDESAQRLQKVEEVLGRRLPLEPCRFIPGLNGEFFQIFRDRVQWFQVDTLIAELPLALIPDYEQIIALDEHTYLFCLHQGYALLDRRQHPRAYRLGAPIITQLRIFGRNNQLADLSAPLSLPPGRNVLRFSYTLPQYTADCRFRYQLKGFDEGWSDWEHTVSREFAALPPGDYRFEVQSSLSPTIAAFEFTIQPPWYRSRLMLLGYILLLAAAAFLLERWQQGRLRRQRRKLEVQRQRELHQERIRARNQQLQMDVLNKSRELANSTSSLIRKNEILLQIKEELQSLKNKTNDSRLNRYFNSLSRLIDEHISSEDDWQLFEANFNQVHEVFFKKLKAEFPELTPGDLRLAAYLKMNLASKEIGPLLNISLRGVENKRYRLRKKIGLHPEANLTEFLMAY